MIKGVAWGSLFEGRVCVMDDDDERGIIRLEGWLLGRNFEMCQK